MTTLEDQLRESLRQHGDIAMPGIDFADAAVAGVHTVRRRRLATAAAATLLVVTVVAVGIVTGRDGRLGDPRTPVGQTPSMVTTQPTTSPQPPVAPPATAPGLDLFVRPNRIQRPNGSTVAIPGGDAAIVAAVPAGWLVTSGAGASRLVRSDGTLVPLTVSIDVSGGSERPRAPAISADGHSIAWVQQGVLATATLGPTGLGPVVQTPVPAKSFATTWVGTRVVVGQTYATGCCGYDKARYDVWDPTGGNFVPHWTTSLFPVYGPIPVGRTPVALSGAGASNNCLVRLDGVHDLSPVESACVAGLGFGSLVGGLSPDGRHLVELDFTTDTIMMVDLTTVFRSPRPIRHYTGREFVAWEDNDHVLAVNRDGRMVRCSVSGASETLLDPSWNSNDLGTLYSPIQRFGV